MQTKLTWLTDVACPWCRRRARTKQGGERFRCLCSQSTCFALLVLESASSACAGRPTVQVASLRRRRTDGKEKFARCKNGNCSTTQSCADRGRTSYTRTKDLKQVLEFPVNLKIDGGKEEGGVKRTPRSRARTLACSPERASERTSERTED